ncbi:MAG: hypothetical protein H7835_18630 [Magnetococcus sp. XQGC-1]
MKKIVQWFVVLWLTIACGQVLAGDQDPKTDWKPNFMYGTSNGASPDYIRLKKWLGEQTARLEVVVKQVIGVNNYNRIAASINNFTSSLSNFFIALKQDKRFEWKASREEGARKESTNEMRQYEFKTNK